MASIQFASYVHGGATSMDSKLNLAQIGQRTQVMTHTGLRLVKTAEVLQMRNKVKASAKQWKNVDTKIVCGTGMNLVFVSAECGPWSKTGGLGDVVGGLPPAMAANGHRVMTVSPRYDQYKDAWDTSVTVEVLVGDKLETVRFFHSWKRGVDRVFVDHPIFLEKVE